MKDLSPETLWPHEVAFLILVAPIVGLMVMVFSLIIMENIMNACPSRKKYYPLLSRYANRRRLCGYRSQNKITVKR